MGNQPCKIITPVVLNATNPAQCYNQANVCKLDIYYPNNTIFYDNATMTNQADCRYSNISKRYNVTGNWNFNVVCQKGNDAGVFSGKVIVNSIKPLRIGNISCQYDRQPYIRTDLPLSEREKINWLCLLGNSEGQSYRCNSYAYSFSENRPLLIQQNPIPENVQGIGVIDYFKPEPELQRNQIANIYFTNKDLRDNRTITFSVICQSNQFNNTISFSKNITPIYKSPYEIIDKGNFLKNNAELLVMLLVGILIFGSIAFIIIKQLRS